MGPPEPPPFCSRWNKGRKWDGVGNWCDAETAQELTNYGMRLSAEPNMTLKPLFERVVSCVPEKRALTYLDGKGKEIDNHSFAEVLTYVRRIASYLQREMGLRPGDRAVLLYPPGQDFILAFMGCVFAGVIPVAVYPPHPYRLELDVPRLKLIVENSGCRVALTDTDYSLVIRAIYVKNLLSKVGLTTAANWPSLRTVCTDKIRRTYTNEDIIEPFTPCPKDVAFLQYTSGSTALPKGVMVTHGNLIAQLRVIHQMSVKASGSFTNDIPAVSWLPQYHDMGLIGSFLACLASGVHLIYLTPISFLQDPTLWLSAMNKYRSFSSAAPNFAFALALKKTSENLRDSYDLSCVKSLICGAEPIRPEVMRAFFDFFGKCGLDPQSVMPAYGLAEYTLCVTAQHAGQPLRLLHVDAALLRSKGVIKLVPEGSEGATTYVGVGTGQGDVALRIVDPDTKKCQGEGRVGEIWTDGPCKAAGYFADDANTQAAFHGVIADERDPNNGQHTYLQTGDQGFLHQGELFITGRIKDLIIIRGRNFYPQDMEYLVERSLSDVLKPGCSGAFSLECKGEEGVAIAAELREVDTRRGGAEEEYRASWSAFLRSSARPSRCKERYLEGSLSAVFSWQFPTLAPYQQWQEEMEEDDAQSESADSFVSIRDAEWLADVGDVGDVGDEKGDVGDKDSDVGDEDGDISDGDIGDKDGDDGDKEGDAGDKKHDVSDEKGEMGNETGGVSDEAGDVGDENGDVGDEDGDTGDEKGDLGGENGDEASERAEGAFIPRLIAHVMESRELPREAVSIDQPLAMLGFDSLAYVALARVMSQWVGKDVSPIVAYRFQTIRELSCYLAGGAQDIDLSGIGGVEESLEADLDGPIAIVGLGCKAPGGKGRANLTTPHDLWQFFMDGGDAVSDDMPDGRRSDSAAAQVPGAYLEGIDGFDPSFFGISEAEAAHLDYRQALVLETAWHALEDAGIDPVSLKGRSVGVYMGAVGQEFGTLDAAGRLSETAGEKDGSSLLSVTGGATSLIANRLSHFLDIRGPSLAIDTACSSSLVAVHDAVRDLRLGSCSMALAGGVNLIITAEQSGLLSDAGLLSSEGCKSFDASADGYCRGEGVGVVVLRRLHHAIASGDRIYAIIRGSAVRHDGKGSGLGVPNATAQEDVLRAAYKEAKVDPSKVCYVEAMGSGSKLGDAMELLALGRVLGQSRPSPESHCLVASGKANLGHSEAAGGVMSLISASLILYHGVIPRALHVTSITDLVPVERMSLAVPLKDTPLPTSTDVESAEGGAVVGVSALGIGGTSTHVVLEAAPKVGGMMVENSYHGDSSELGASEAGETFLAPLLLPISARSDAALRALAQSYQDLLSAMPSGASGYERAKALCSSACKHRTHLRPYRLAATGRSPSELIASLTSALEGLKAPASATTSRTSHHHSPAVEASFFFPDPLPGAQADAVLKMGRGMYASQNAIFRGSVEECESAFGGGVVAAFSSGPSAGGTNTRAAVFAAQYGLAKVWSVLGVKPVEVEGRGLGALVAIAVREGSRALKDLAARVVTEEHEAKDTEEKKEEEEEVEVAMKAQPPTEGVHVSFKLDKDDVELDASSLGKTTSLASSGHTSSYTSSDCSAEGSPRGPHPIEAALTLLSDSDDETVDIESSHGVKAQPMRGDHVAFVMGPSIADPSLLPHASSIVPMLDSDGGDDAPLALARALALAYSAGLTLELSLYTTQRDGDGEAPLDRLPLYPFQEHVHAPLPELLQRAFSSRHGSRKDYGVTSMFEESWVPRLDASRTQSSCPPPEHTVWVCAKPKDAAALVTSARLSRDTSSHVVVVPFEDLVKVEALIASGSRNRDLRRRSAPSLVSAHISHGEASKSLCDALRCAGGETRMISSMAVVYVAGESSQSLDDPDALANESYQSLLRLLGLLRCVVHASNKENHRPLSTRVWVVTSGARAIDSRRDVVRGLNHSLWAMTKSALHEFYPAGLWATLVDVQSGMETQDLVGVMQEEMRGSSRQSAPEQLALRDGQWHVMRLRASPINALVSKHTPEPTFAGKEEGWFLITGGLGGLGLHAACCLVRHGAKRLLLTSRTGVVAERYQEVLDWIRKQPGMEVCIAACEVSVRSSVLRLFSATSGGIRGIVHCAGALSDGQLPTQDADKLNLAWEGKVIGALNLHIASQRQLLPLDLFLIYGSSSSLLGSPGESTYAAANAATDAIASLRRQQGLCGTSLQWGTWTGLGFASSAFNDELAKAGFRAITHHHGTRMVNALLNEHASLPPVLACVPIHWSTLVSQGPAYLTDACLSTFDAVKAHASSPSPPTDTVTTQTPDLIAYGELKDASARRAMVEKTLTESIHEVSGLMLGRDESLMAAGINSLQAMQLVHLLTKRLALRVKPTKLAEYPTISDLTLFICQELDKIVEGSKPRILPLSPSQEALLSSSSSFLYHEQIVTSAVALPALLSAFTALLSRHALLRTTIDRHAHTQHVLDAASTPLSDLYIALPDTGCARDVTALEGLLAAADKHASSLPPVRLFSAARQQAGGAVVVLAVSRLLADCYTLRHLSAELMALYSQSLPGAGVSSSLAVLPLPSFLTDLKENGAATQHEAAVETQPRMPAIVGLRRSTSSIVHPQSVRMTIPAALANDVASFAARGGVRPSSVLLSAFATTLAQHSKADADATLPLNAEIDRADGTLGPSANAPINLVLQRSQLSSVKAVEDTISDAPSSPCSWSHVPCFIFRDVRGAALGSYAWLQPELAMIGESPAAAPSAEAPLCLQIEARHSPSGGAEYIMTVTAGEDYEMKGMQTFAQRVLSNAAAIAGTSHEGKKSLTSPPAPSAAKDSKCTDKAHDKAMRGADRALPYLIVVILQFIAIGVMGWVVSLPVLLIWPIIELSLFHLGLYGTLCTIPGITHLVGLMMCFEVICLRALVGQPCAGVYAVNSWSYIRWWFQSRMVSFIEPFYINGMRGTLVHAWWLRALGAQVGEGVRLDSVKVTDPDLVSIGDNASFGASSRLIGSVVRGGMLHRGRIEVGRECLLLAHAVMLPNSRMEERSTLEARGVVAEGQAVVGGGVYAGSPASFLRPRPASDARHPNTVSFLYEVLCTIVQGSVPLAIATLSASLAWEPLTLLLKAESVFPYFDWQHWPQGRIIFCLFSTLSFAALLSFPILFTFMTVKAFALEFSEPMLVTIAHQVGIYNVSGAKLRSILYDPKLLEFYKKLLPKGIQMLGEAGSHNLEFVAPGRMAMRVLILKYEVLPEAYEFGIIGKFWIFAVGTAIQGFIMTAICTFIISFLRQLEDGRGEGASEGQSDEENEQVWRMGGLAAGARSLRMSLMRWTWAHFMQLFAGTKVLCWWYRLLGARVGRGVVIGNVPMPADPHLLSLGVDVALMDGSVLDTAREEEGGVIRGRRITLGEGVLVGMRAVVEGGAQMGPKSVAVPLSAISLKSRVEERAVMEGAPATKALMRPDEEGDKGKGGCGSAVYRVVVGGVLQGFLGPLFSCLLNLLFVTMSMYHPYAAMVWCLTQGPLGLGWSFTAVAVGMCIFHWGFLVSLLVHVVAHKWMCAWLMKPAQAFGLDSLTYHRRLSALVLQGFATTVMFDQLRGSVFAPLYLRLLGAKTHFRAVINSLEVNDPDLLTVGSGGVLDEDSIACTYTVEEDRQMVLGQVCVHQGGRMGVGSIALRGAIVQNQAELADVSLLPPDAEIRAGTVRKGTAIEEEEGGEEAGLAGRGRPILITVPVSVLGKE